MPTPNEVRERAPAGENGHLPGYAECHFCTVKRKRRSWRCSRCVGRLGLRDRIVRAAEDRARRRVASALSFLLPGLGHFYRSSPGTGFFFLAVMGISVAYFVLIEGEMTSGRWFTVAALVLVYLAQIVDAGRGPGEAAPPCQEACPAGLACMRYVNLTREGMNREALEMVQLNCPFPGTVGRVCHHPCEQNCRRAEEGEAIAICAIKRYLADEAGAGSDGFYPSERTERTFTEKIAVVGGGPSGLSAALYLRILGFEVTVLEASDRLGGMPEAVIPEYRLPKWVLREEIERMVSAGIEVRHGERLGTDFTLQDLQSRGYAAVYLALGAQRTVRLPHCGTPAEGFLDGIEFLRASKDGTQERLWGSVLVIGGGNVAVDVAKTAVRMGGEDVRKIFLETRETMPAHLWECQEAMEEGVKLIPAAATVEFRKENGRVVSALCRKVERIEIDENRRIRPVLSEGTDFTLQADWVITAVGTGPDYSVLQEPPRMKPLRQGVRAGRLPVQDGLRIPVIVGGDFFSGPASVIEAIAAGWEGALEIYRALGKTSLFPRPARNRVRRIRYEGYLDDPGKAGRKHPVKVDPEVRCESFCEICESYSTVVASEEAARCLRCSWPMKKAKKKRAPRIIAPDFTTKPGV